MASKITVGKIVANATETGWSQAYHAGGFTAVVSLTIPEPSEEAPLQASGKELLDTLVSEYFTLTTKDLDTVRQAVVATVEKAPKHIQVSLIVAAVVKNVLYVVIANEGKVLLKRGEKLGMLLAVTPQDEEKIASVSGFLEHNDIVLLYTNGFGKIFPHDELVNAFDNKTAEELAEFFAPKIHGGENGDASALVFSYHEDEAEYKSVSAEALTQEPVKEEARKEKLPEEDHRPPAPTHKEEPTTEEPDTAPFARQSTQLPGFEKPLGTPRKPSFSHRQKLFLTITVLLGLVMIGSIVVFQMRQSAAKQQELFQSLYQPAKSKYDESLGLLDLNKSLAIEDLQSVVTQLNDAKPKFPANSEEEKQIVTLLAQANKTLEDAKKVPLITAQKAADTASPLLNFAAKHDSTYYTQDTNNFYTADNTAITQYDKKTQTAKKIITNSNDWKQIGGFDTYFGNMYVADTKDGIDKFASGSFAKSAYFTDGTKPDLSNIVSLSIDSSIWTLASDGTINKYTKGAQDSLTVSGLDKPLSGPTQILTSADLDNVYVLDKGNSRVVVLKKDGSFVAQYASDTVRTATAMDVSEKDKKIYLLSTGTVYQLDLK